MRPKIIKVIILIIVTLVISFLATMLIPIKFCLPSLPEGNDEDFYVIRYSRSINRWIIIGDKTGLFEENISLEQIAWPIENWFEFEEIASVDLYMQGDATCFIVYGAATTEEYLDKRHNGKETAVRCYTIDCTGWDILGEINTMNTVRGIFPRSYLNIYDCRWFDVLRDRLFFYLDGETNF